MPPSSFPPFSSSSTSSYSVQPTTTTTTTNTHNRAKRRPSTTTLKDVTLQLDATFSILFKVLVESGVSPASIVELQLSTNYTGVLERCLDYCKCMLPEHNEMCCMLLMQAWQALCLGDAIQRRTCIKELIELSEYEQGDVESCRRVTIHLQQVTETLAANQLGLYRLESYCKRRFL